MRTLAIALSLSLLAGSAPASVVSTAEPVFEVSTITVTAPRVRPETEIRILETARAGGAGVGVAGAGLMAYVLVLDLAGPFGWAASLLFLGGMTSYLSHRRLQGYNDFPPGAAVSSGTPRAQADAR